MSKSIKADLMLLFVTLGWGLSYYFVDVSLIEMEVFSLNAFRFLLAFIVAGILSFNKLKKVSKETIKYSFILGFVLFMVYIGATFGVKYTTLSNTGFLCALAVIFTPILTFLYYRFIPSKKTLLAIILSFVGIALLTLSDDFAINPKYLKGDLLSIMCAFFFAHHLLITEKAVKKDNVDPFQLSVYQMLFCGVFNLILSFIVETPRLPSSGNVWAAAIFLAVVCSGLAFIIQTLAQQHTSATHVAIIFSLEPVFAGAAAYFLAGEVLTPKAYLGAAIMLLSIFIMEFNFDMFKHKSPATKYTSN